MANLTVTVAVTTGTQYVTGDSGNIFTFDGSQPASFTFPWVEDGTLRLDQSGSTNDGHPLIFSTSNSETLGTMRAGIISSGVTYYLDGSSNQSDYTNTTTFNAATTRYIEITPSAETDFYFACYVHGIGMGGIVDITETAWGAMSWGRGTWNDQEKLNEGWGRLGWGDQSWDGSPYVTLTGLSATTALGSVIAFNEQGWGRDAWGDENWGESALTVSLTGLSMTSALGSPTPGWGELAWNNSDYGWGYPVIPEQMMGLTGISAAGTLGSLTVTPNTIAALTGESAASGLGSVNINIGVPLTGIAAATTVGTPTARSYHTITLTGMALASDIGTPTITSNPTVQPTGVSATSSVGAITPADQVMGLTGISATSSVGAITPTDQVMGLTGISATITLGTVSPLHYRADTITGSTSYTDVDITGSTSYTKDTHAG
jgi:hypothetical protein